MGPVVYAPSRSSPMLSNSVAWDAESRPVQERRAGGRLEEDGSGMVVIGIEFLDTIAGRMTNRGTEPKSHEVTEACWWRRAAARSSDRPDSMPRASTSRSGVAAKSPVIPKVTVPQ